MKDQGNTIKIFNRIINLKWMRSIIIWEVSKTNEKDEWLYKIQLDLKLFQIKLAIESIKKCKILINNNKKLTMFHKWIIFNQTLILKLIINNIMGVSAHKHPRHFRIKEFLTKIKI